MANRTTAHGDVTVGAWLFEEATHSMVFLRRDTVQWEAPLAPPFVDLAAPRTVANPIDAVHAQLAEFYRTRLTSGRAVVVDPSAP